MCVWSEALSWSGKVSQRGSQLSFCQQSKETSPHCRVFLRESEWSREDDDEDKTDSVQNLLLGDSGVGAELDKRGPQHAQGGRHQGECGVTL